MTARVSVLQGFDRDMGVNLSRLQFAVTEHRLDVAQVAAVFQKQRGEGVPEEMTRADFADLRFADDLTDLAAEPAGSDALAERVEEEGAFVELMTETRADFHEIFFDPLDRAFADGHIAIFLSLALLDARQTAIVINVAQLEHAKLRSADAGRVKRFEDGAELDPVGCCEVGHVHDRFDFARAEDDFGQAELAPRHLQIARRIVERETFFGQPGEEVGDRLEPVLLRADSQRGAALFFAIVVKVALVIDDDGAGDLAGLSQAERFAKDSEVTQHLGLAVERLRRVIADAQRFEITPAQVEQALRIIGRV